MKKAKIILGTALTLVPLAGAGRVSAQSAPAAPPPASTFGQRLEQRKAERKIQLEERDSKRFQQTCVKAQGSVRQIQQKAGPIISNRAKVYQRIDGKLWIVIGQLKLAERDSFELEKQRAALAEKAAAFQAIANNYQQTLDDIVVINCQADIIGFKALLDTARIYHTQMRDQSADFKNFLVDQVKPVIAAHATALQPKPATEGEQ